MKKNKRLVRCRACGNYRSTIEQVVRQKGQAITCHCGRKP